MWNIELKLQWQQAQSKQQCLSCPLVCTKLLMSLLQQASLYLMWQCLRMSGSSASAVVWPPSVFHGLPRECLQRSSLRKVAGSSSTPAAADHQPNLETFEDLENDKEETSTEPSDSCHDEVEEEELPELEVCSLLGPRLG